MASALRVARVTRLCVLCFAHCVLLLFWHAGHMLLSGFVFFLKHLLHRPSLMTSALRAAVASFRPAIRHDILDFCVRELGVLGGVGD